MFDEKVMKLVELVEEAGDLRHISTEAIAGYVHNQHMQDEDDPDVEDIANGIEDKFVGEFGSNADFAEHLANEMGLYHWRDAEWPLTCIDWESAAVDIMYDYDEFDGHYFRNC